MQIIQESYRSNLLLTKRRRQEDPSEATHLTEMFLKQDIVTFSMHDGSWNGMFQVIAKPQLVYNCLQWNKSHADWLEILNKNQGHMLPSSALVLSQTSSTVNPACRMVQTWTVREAALSQTRSPASLVSCLRGDQYQMLRASIRTGWAHNDTSQNAFPEPKRCPWIQ